LRFQLMLASYFSPSCRSFSSLTPSAYPAARFAASASRFVPSALLALILGYLGVSHGQNLRFRLWRGFGLIGHLVSEPLHSGLDSP
jgi:hypothetical protein